MFQKFNSSMKMTGIVGFVFLLLEGLAIVRLPHYIIIPRAYVQTA